MYRPSELLESLRSLGMTPKKGLSQNFLIDQNILKKILFEADIKKGDVVFEIGPGLGGLTNALLAAEATVYAVEKDRTFISHLENLEHKPKRLHIYEGDIMSFPFQETLPKSKKIKVVANIPYHLTTPILALLLPFRHRFSTLTLMVQDEVARRITALPKTSEYSSLTLFAQAQSDVRYCFKVSRRSFFPAPKVDSAVISFRLKKPPPDPDTLFLLIRRAFMQRRKMLRSSLREMADPALIMSALQAMGQNPEARPEELSLGDFLNLRRSIKYN